MKKIMPIIEIAVVLAFVVVAGVGSYRAQFRSLEVKAPETVPEIITVVEYVELSPEQEALPSKVTPVESKEMFVASDIPQLREGEGFLNLTFEEQDLLERIAMAEAKGEGTEGMLLVMCVVMNRCEKFGASVHDVIYAPSQFYTAGMNVTPSEECHEALALLMDGVDPSQGAIYFCSTGYSAYGEPLMQVGNHYFSA